MWPATASDRASCCAAEPLFPLLDDETSRSLRVRLSYRAFGGGICTYAEAGAFPLGEAIALCDIIREREAADFEALTRGIAAACWGNPGGTDGGEGSA